MIIGVPKEIKPQENRIGAVPAMVLDLVEAGHTVLVEKDERDTGSKCRARKCCSDMACAQKAKCSVPSVVHFTLCTPPCVALLSVF